MFVLHFWWKVNSRLSSRELTFLKMIKGVTVPFRIYFARFEAELQRTIFDTKPADEKNVEVQKVPQNHQEYF